MATPKILLVDDTKLFLKLEQEYLKQSSVTVYTASNGREALEMIRENRPDLIYMDLNMPEMDGVTCCATIKADPDLRSIPVILVTTEGHGESVERCKKAGCDGYLSKPIDRRLFLELGRSFLQNINRRARRVSCRTKLLFRVNSGENIHGTCLDLCTGGLYVICDRVYEVGDTVEVSLLASGSSNDLVEAWGRVAWTNCTPLKKKQRLPEGFGVEFLAITEESLVLINKLLAKGAADLKQDL
jgi:CheY-like chemotaxis protein/Tfp pilus assembly protein PilZ